MENQGKKKSQLNDAETFAIIGLITIIIVIMVMLSSCGTSAQTTPQEDEKVYIHMSNGDRLELVADEYGNQYLKQESSIGVHIYIPYPGDTDDGSDSLQFYNAKNQNNGSLSIY